MRRIGFLDGFRGFAILLVILFHAFSCWIGQVPYGDRFANLFPFKQGFLGVQLFFLISGFVIIMSLEKTNNFIEFIYKRWIRLFPAMLIATILIFSTVPLIVERLNGIPRLQDAIPGLIFIQANDIKKIFHIDVLDLENPFWSLYVEVKFYFVFGFLYYFLGTRKAIWSIFGLFIVWCILTCFNNLLFTQINYLYLLLKNLGVVNYGWFSSGAMAYLYYINRDKKDLLYAIIFGLLSVLMLSGIKNIIFMLVLLIFFISAICYEKFAIYFNNKFLLFYGFISYPLYLIHESAMIGLIVKIRNFTDLIPDILLPLIPILFLSGVAYMIAKFIEPFVRKLIDSKVQRYLDNILSKRKFYKSFK